MVNRSIRQAQLSDVEAVSDIYRRSSLSNDGDAASLIANPEALVFDDAAIHEQRTRVAVDEGRIVGFATTSLVGDVTELDDLFVDPDWMRRGVGRDLVLDAAAVASASQTIRVEVTANPHALDFYDNVGFVIDGVAQTQFGSGIRMHLDVTP